MSEGPKLFNNKPKKSKLKQNQVQQGTPAPLTMASSSSTGIGTDPRPPPPPVKESFARRYKFLWPLLLAVNFTVGAYLFTRTKKKDVGTTEESDLPIVSTTPKSTSTPAAVAAATVTETPVTPPVMQPAPRAPIPEDQQRELFKWILEEKRKVKPKDAEDKKRIDEEKAFIKQFIRVKSIPSL
ncbi:hypothetical protein ACJIZ3_025410 [Penstemon smallii]|uniref:Uncharacterized protein n=1 Tax=Penstemon smallii TaxID=265156 RepID=A0ABD3TUJ0_9LAMI